MTEIARSMAYQDLYWRSSDGLRLHARDYAAAPGGSGLPVICIPGLTRNRNCLAGAGPKPNVTDHAPARNRA